MSPALTRLPRGTVTFLFTDIEGSTRLLEEHGEDYPTLLAEHRRVLREAFERHAGVEVDTQGDAFFVAFSRALDALAAAEEAQRALELRVRMGIHTGQPQLVGEGYVGIDVHRAARICSAAHGGQVVLSQRSLVDGVAVRDLGLHRLKDLQEPERLYQLGAEEFPPLRSLNATNLPVQPNPLVGRERELEEVTALAGDGARLLTLTGPGGTGKTRLALQAAAELTDDFPDGVFWVPLAALRDPELVLPTIEQTLGAKVPLSEHVDEKRLLLLLDNLEQVVEGAPALAEILARCPNLKLLATSRVLLRIQGEREYEVPPLPESDSVTLFRERAVVDKPEEAVREICRRLDGLPLAIELAAARTRVLPPDKLLARLEQRLPLLTGGTRDAPERQRTLRATIEWSYELLDPDEQEFFRRLSVFAAGFTLEAAEEVCEAELDTLESLVEKSLVRQKGGRFSMLETIREFGVEKLEASQETEHLRRMHAEYFVALAGRLSESLAHLDADAVAVMTRLSDEVDNIRACLDWLLANDPDRAVEMLRATRGFWTRSGRSKEGRRWSERVLAKLPPGSPSRCRALEIAGRFAGNLRDRERAEALTGEALMLARAQGDDGTVGRLLITLGELALRRQAVDRAERCFKEALSLLRAVGDDWGIAFALANFARVAEARGDLDEAEKLVGDALEHARSRNLFNLPPLLGRAAELALKKGDGARAEDLFRAALDLALRWHQVLTVDDDLAGIAAARALRGDVAGAVRACEAVEALNDAPGRSPAFEDYMQYLDAIPLPALDSRREMTVEEAIEYALTDDG
jgi:predicted ATPase